MDKEETDPTNELRHQLGRLIVATAAGFVASKMAENLYNNILTSRMTVKTVETEDQT